MMQTLARVGFHQSYTYFTWRNGEVGARGVPHRAAPADRRTTCGRTSSSTPRTSCTPTCSTAGRRRSRSGPCSRRRCRPSWGVYAGYELFEHVAVRPGSEEYLDSEKYQFRPRDWAAAEARGPHRSRRTSPGSTRSAATTRRCSGCATCASTTPTTTRSSASRKRDGHRRAATTPCSSWSTSTRTASARRRSHLDMPALGLDWHDTLRRPRRGHRRDLRLGRAQLRPARPVRRAGPRLHRRARDADVSPTMTHAIDNFADVPDERARPALVQARRLLRGAGPRRSTTATATAPATCAA